MVSSPLPAPPTAPIAPIAPTAPIPPTAPARSLSGLLPFLRPYRGRIAIALLFLILAAAATLAFPLALRTLIDAGMGSADERSAQALALRGRFLALFGVAVALGLFSAARFYMVSWLGERITADLRNAVYTHVLRQSPQFFETTQSGEVLSRLTTDTTLVQTVVGSSLSMGLRNAVIGLPDEKWGERPLALVVLKQGLEADVSEHAIRNFAAHLIESTGVSRHGVLLQVQFVKELAKTSVGKINKRAMREARMPE